MSTRAQGGERRLRSTKLVSYFFAHMYICVDAISAVIEYYMRTQGWTEQNVREQIIDVVPDAVVSSFSAIDLTSIMMCVPNL